MVERIEVDPNTLTLGEVLAVERASGKQFGELILTRTGQLAAVVYVSRLRQSEKERTPLPDWQEILSLRLRDVSSSVLASEPDSPGPKSND